MKNYGEGERVRRFSREGCWRCVMLPSGGLLEKCPQLPGCMYFSCVPSHPRTLGWGTAALFARAFLVAG